MRESLLQTKVMRYLHSRGVYARKIHDTYLSGFPDIICVVVGKAVFFELKSDKGKLSKIQEVEKEKIQRSCGLFFVIRTMDELKIALEIALEK